MSNSNYEGDQDQPPVSASQSLFHIQGPSSNNHAQSIPLVFNGLSGMVAVNEVNSLTGLALTGQPNANAAILPPLFVAEPEVPILPPSPNNVVQVNERERPKCSKCGNHNVENPIQGKLSNNCNSNYNTFVKIGHQRYCEFKDCQCRKCQFVNFRHELVRKPIMMRKRHIEILTEIARIGSKMDPLIKQLTEKCRNHVVQESVILDCILTLITGFKYNSIRALKLKENSKC